MSRHAFLACRLFVFGALGATNAARGGTAVTI
jgi:hypothetical protein